MAITAANIVHAIDARRHNVAIDCASLGFRYSEYQEYVASLALPVPTVSSREYNRMRAEYDV